MSDKPLLAPSPSELAARRRAGPIQEGVPLAPGLLGSPRSLVARKPMNLQWRPKPRLVLETTEEKRRRQGG